jgi:type I restriction enzyme S subunit
MFKDYANVLIKDISKINTNTYKNKYNWNYILYLDTKNITNNTINHVKKYTSKDNIPNRAKRIVKKNDIIISTVRPIQEHYGILREIPKNLLVSTAFVVISPNNNIVDNDYLYYFLTQKYITKSLQDIAEQGTTSYPSITRKDIENIELVLPSLKYQRQISHILRNIDKKIATNKKINKNLNSLLRSLFKHWIINYQIPKSFNINHTYRETKKYESIEMPDDWVIFNFKDKCNFIKGKKPKNI